MNLNIKYPIKIQDFYRMYISDSYIPSRKISTSSVITSCLKDIDSFEKHISDYKKAQNKLSINQHNIGRIKVLQSQLLEIDEKLSSLKPVSLL